MYHFFRALQKDAERLSAEESGWRRERMDFERNIALIKHDLREAMRKHELETDGRKSLETKLRSTEEQLQVGDLLSKCASCRED